MMCNTRTLPARAPSHYYKPPGVAAGRPAARTTVPEPPRRRGASREAHSTHGALD